VSALLSSADHSYFRPQKEKCSTHVIFGHEVEAAATEFHSYCERLGNVTHYCALYVVCFNVHRCHCCV